VACNELFNNFPIRWLGKVFRALIFPWGDAYHKPTDSLSHKIVSKMVVPSDFRDRLTKYCFISKESNDPMHRMDNTLLKAFGADPIFKKFQLATKGGTVSRVGSFEERIKSAVLNGVLTENEMNTLSEFNNMYQEMIRVNEFTFDLSTIVK
jgi:hypothetical protein